MRTLKWILGIILLTNLCCFYPGDMTPLPLFVYETGVIDYAFLINFDLAGFGAKSILIGQVLILWALITKNIKTIITLGRISTALLIIGTPFIMNYRNVNGWTFEFTTWIPFFLSGIVFLYFSVKLDKKVNNSQHMV